MKIAIYGDSLACPSHFDISRKANPKIKDEDRSKLWTSLLSKEYDVKFFTSHSRSAFWVDAEWRKYSPYFDINIIRSNNWDSPDTIECPSYTALIENKFSNLKPFPAFATDREDEYVKAVDTYYKYFFNNEYSLRAFNLLVSEWINEPSTLFISPLMNDVTRTINHKKLTKWIVNSDKNILHEKKNWLNVLEQKHKRKLNFNKVPIRISHQIFHKHPNHIPIQDHYSVYKHIKAFINGEVPPPIEISKWGYYEEDCYICQKIEKEMLCQQED